MLRRSILAGLFQAMEGQNRTRQGLSKWPRGRLNTPSMANPIYQRDRGLFRIISLRIAGVWGKLGIVPTTGIRKWQGALGRSEDSLSGQF